MKTRVKTTKMTLREMTHVQSITIERVVLDQSCNDNPTTKSPTANQDQPERQLAQISRPQIGRRPED